MCLKKKIDKVENMSTIEEEKTITIEYYAILREQRGCQSETIKTDAATAGDLYQQMQAKHSLSLDQNTIKVAINHEFRDWNTTLADNDTLVFIPPVAGG